MKDTLMTVTFDKGSIQIWHKTQMGDLGALFAMGNSYRHEEGSPPAALAAWIKRQDTQEYIEYLSNRLGRPAVEKRKGKGGGTYAHLNILIDAAVSLSPRFKDEVYETFINGKVLVWREESGENFKDMNSMLDLCAESVLGKPAHSGHYVNLAKIIRARVGAESWDTATGYQLAQRTRIEEDISKMLRLNLVRDWEHLKQIAEQI